MKYFTKLFLLIIGIAAISSSIISIIIILINVDHMKETTRSNLLNSSQQKLSIFEGNVDQLHSLSMTISNDSDILQYFINLSNGIEDEGYRRKLSTNLEADMKLYTKLLENAFFTYEGAILIDGMRTASVGLSTEQSEWYINVKKTKEHYLEKVKKSPVTGMPVMISAQPLLGEENKLVSIFCLSINLNGFSNDITNNSGTTAENTMVIDMAGSVIAASDTDLIYTYDFKNEQVDLYQYIEENEGGITFFSKDGISYMAAVQKSNLGVAILQYIPVSVYQKPVTLSIVLSVLIIIVILGVASMIAYLIASSITLPIRILVTQMEEMSEGKYDKEIPGALKNRRDEFADLGVALEVMKDQTNQLIIKLELANEEAEASLEEVLATEEELRIQNEMLIRSEKKIKNSNEYNQAIIDVLPDVIVVIDKKGNIIGNQEGADTSMRFPNGNLVQKDLYSVLDHENADNLMIKVNLAIETGKLQKYEYEFNSENQSKIFEIRIIHCFEDNVLAIARDITEQRLYQRQIEYLSYHDQLTGLPNRRNFEETIKRLDHEKYLPLCIMIADVNGLKLVNDSFGHKAGDQLLIKFAKVLRENINEENLISRIGGDEFILFIPNIEEGFIDNLYGRIRKACEKETVSGIKLSVSLGWDVKYHIEEDVSAILKSAEDIMYKKKLHEGPSMRGRTIDIILKTLNEKNCREEQHSCRVSELCEKLARAIGMPEHNCKEIKSAGLLHDIGKIAIAEELLNKPGRLTEEEYSDIKRHPEIGYRILCSSGDMQDIAEVILYHHERWDGKGYPKGLKGEEIPLQARMIAIADTYDAMTSQRSYREAISMEEAAKELLRNAGTQFDANLVEMFVHRVLGM